MTLGTGIFLSSAFLGLILLFGMTKDRWNWRKISIRFCMVAVVIPAAIAVYLWLSDDVSRTFYRLTASKQTELWGIKLGSSKADVLFLKGKAKESDDALLYSDYVILLNKNGVVDQIVFKGDYFRHEGFFGVRIGTRVEDLEATLGAPSNIVRGSNVRGSNNDETWRRYEYEKYNLMFMLKEGQVSAYGVKETFKSVSPALVRLNCPL